MIKPRAHEMKFNQLNWRVFFALTVLGSIGVFFQNCAEDLPNLTDQTTEVSSTGLSTSCQITQNACITHPSAVGTFSDDFENAGSNQARCMQRAADYHSWCGNPATIITTAAYYIDNVLQQTAVIGSMCQIIQDTCLAHPSAVGTFSDNFDNAGSNQTRCMQRAADYHSWCGNPATSKTTAAYYVNGVLLQITSSP